MNTPQDPTADRQQLCRSIRDALNEMGVKFGEDPDATFFGFSALMETYRDGNDRPQAQIAISLARDASRVFFVAPTAYPIALEHAHRDAVLATVKLLEIGDGRLRYEYLSETGSLAPMITLTAAEAADPTRCQHALKSLVVTLDSQHAPIRHAIEKGSVSLMKVTVAKVVLSKISEVMAANRPGAKAEEAAAPEGTDREATAPGAQHQKATGSLLEGILAEDARAAA